MKKTLLGIALISFIACKQSDHKESTTPSAPFTTEQTITIEDLPKEWHALTTAGNNLPDGHPEKEFIYHPCEVVNETINFTKEEGFWRLIFATGQEAIFYNVQSVHMDKDDVVITARYYENSDTDVLFILEDFELGKNKIKWKLPEYFGMQANFTTKEGLKNYKVIIEECDENF